VEIKLERKEIIQAFKNYFKNDWQHEFRDFELIKNGWYEAITKDSSNRQIQRRVMPPPKTNDGWCANDCPYFEQYGNAFDLTARCKLLKIEKLYFNDWFIAECKDKSV